jgi:CRP/FNR family transcriptional regulator, cyclic AMP receptor protein
VNAVLKTLEQQGLVSLEFGRVSIVDEARLMALAMRPDPEADKDAD